MLLKEAVSCPWRSGICTPSLLLKLTYPLFRNKAEYDFRRKQGGDACRDGLPLHSCRRSYDSSCLREKNSGVCSGCEMLKQTVSPIQDYSAGLSKLNCRSRWMVPSEKSESYIPYFSRFCTKIENRGKSIAKNVSQDVTPGKRAQH